MGNPLTILGIEIRLNLFGSFSRPDSEKVAKWTRQINGLLSARRLLSGEASELSGVLPWGTQWVYKRMGRAKLRSIVRHRTPEFSYEFSLALLR